MSRWGDFISRVGGVRVIWALGALFVTLGIARSVLNVAAGASLAEALDEVVLIGIPGLGLLYGGHWLSRSDIRPDVYPRVAGWCLGVVGVMLGIVVIRVLSPGSTIENPLWSLALATALGSVAGLAIGSNEGRAISRARDAEQNRDELRQERDLRDHIVETSPVGIAMVDADGSIRMVNEHAADIVGIPRDEATDLRYDEPMFTEPGTTDDTIFERIRTTGEPVFDEERRVASADGEHIWLSVNGTPLHDQDGDITAVVFTFEDVTDRRETRQALEESERRYRTLVENFPNGAVALVDEDLRYRTVGGDPFEVARLTVEEVEGSAVGDILPSDLADELVPRYEDAFDGESSTFEAESNGKIYQFQVVPVWDSDGDVFAAMGMSQDITERREYAQRLEESQRRYRTLVENFPDGAVGLFDEDLKYTVAGGQLLDEVGVDEAERVGQSISEIYPDELVGELEPYFKAALEGETNSFEVEFHDRHLDAHTLPVRDAADEVFAAMIVVQDITERNEMEQELRESEAKFRMIAENLEGIVWMATPNAEEFIYINPAFEEVWGLDRQQLYDDPLSFLDVVHEDDRERVREQFTALPEEDFEAEYRIVRSDGEVRWVYARGTSVYDEDSGMERIVGIGEDVTERVERERQLEESERRYRTLAEHFPNGAVGIYDHDLRYSLVEGGMWDEMDAEPEDLEGVTVQEFFPPETADDIVPNFQAAVEDGETTRTETEWHGRTFHVWTTPLRDSEDDIFAGLSFAQNVTDHVERERQLEELVEKLEVSNERLEQFAYAASHDLQEPLRMVSSYLQLLESRYDEELDDEGREFLEFAVDGADRMREMIEGLLEYSRVETRGEPFEPVDLDAVLADVCDDLQMKIEETDADLTVEDLPWVQGDASQLRQAFQNLLENALEYSGDEPPSVHVGAEHDGDEWVVSVRDEGIGIDPARSDRIFQVFERLHSSDAYSGAGIGLALCNRIVERHGGELWVESEPDEGATFYLTLPPAETQQSTSITHAPPKQEHSNNRNQ